MSQFSNMVIKVVNHIPYGKVVSYGQIAAYVGVPRAEGIEVGEDYRVDMAKYRYLAAEDQLKSWGLDTYYVQIIWDKFKGAY